MRNCLYLYEGNSVLSKVLSSHQARDFASIDFITRCYFNFTDEKIRFLLGSVTRISQQIQNVDGRRTNWDVALRASTSNSSLLHHAAAGFQIIPCFYHCSHLSSLLPYLLLFIILSMLPFSHFVVALYFPISPSLSVFLLLVFMQECVPSSVFRPLLHAGPSLLSPT